MTTLAPQNQASPPTDLAAEIEATVDRLIAAHRTWLAAVKDHRAALSTADTEGIAVALGQQNEIGGLVRDLEAVLRDGLGGATVRVFAAAQPEPLKARLAEKAETLRSLAIETRREQSVVLGASRSLLAHMQGVVSQVAAALNHAGVYGRAGRVDAGPVVVSALDIKH